MCVSLEMLTLEKPVTVEDSRTGMGKLWPGGHMRPVKLLSPARRISRNDINSK